MSGGKGGSQTSKVQIPKWIEEPSIRNIARAEQVARMGYQPYYGPEVAAFNPMQEQAMQSQYDAAAAFGLAPQGGNAMAGIPQATEFAGGVRGYGSGDLFEQAVNEFQKRQPDQAALYASQFVGPDINPINTGGNQNQRPVMNGYTGGKGGAQVTGGFNEGGQSNVNDFTSFSNPGSSFNPFGGYDIPVVSGSGPIVRRPGGSGGAPAPIDMNRPFIEGMYPNGYPTVPSNPNGIPVGNDYSPFGLIGMMGA